MELYAYMVVYSMGTLKVLVGRAIGMPQFQFAVFRKGVVRYLTVYIIEKENLNFKNLNFGLRVLILSEIFKLKFKILKCDDT